MLSRSWNVNLRTLFNLPRETPSWIVEELSGGRHFMQMIFSRFCSYLKSIRYHKKPFIRTLYSIVKEDVNSTTGSNIRTVLNTSGVDPRYRNSKYLLKNWRVHCRHDDWTVPLLASLIELKTVNWEVHFDGRSVFLPLQVLKHFVGKADGGAKVYFIW